MPWKLGSDKNALAYKTTNITLYFVIAIATTLKNCHFSTQIWYRSRVAQSAEDKNLDPQHTLFCCKIRFVANCALLLFEIFVFCLKVPQIVPACFCRSNDRYWDFPVLRKSESSRLIDTAVSKTIRIYARIPYSNFTQFQISQFDALLLTLGGVELHVFWYNSILVTHWRSPTLSD